MKNSLRSIFLAILFFTIILCNSVSAEWQQTNGPQGANVACFAVSGSNLFIGTARHGVFLSTDNGARWINRSEGLIRLYARAVAVRDLVIYNNNVVAGTRAGVFFPLITEKIGWL